MDIQLYSIGGRLIEMKESSYKANSAFYDKQRIRHGVASKSQIKKKYGDVKQVKEEKKVKVAPNQVKKD